MLNRHYGIFGLLVASATGQAPNDRHYMPGSDLTSWDPLFKQDYAPAIINALAEDTHAIDFMVKETPDESWRGREKIQPVKIGRNWSVGSIGAQGALPQQGRSVYKDFVIPMRDTYGRVGFERYVIEQSKGKKGSYASVVPEEMDGLVDDLTFARNRMAWGYGSGILALVNGAVAGGVATVNCDAPGNVAGAVMGNRYIFGDATSGMFVAFLNPTTFLIEHTAFVSAVAAAGTSFTIDVAAPVGGITDNALIVLAQTPTQHSRNKEPEGILAGIDDSTYVDTYHGLARSTYDVLKSYVTTGVGALSLDAIQQNCDAVAIRVKAGLDLLAAEFAVQRAYLVLLEADRRYTGADLMRPDGGTVAAKKPDKRRITFGDIPLMVDRDAPYRMLFGMTKESWVRYVLSEGQWADDEGSVLKWVSGFDQYTAFWYILDNFHCQKANRNFRMEGIDVTQLAVHAF